MQDQPTHAASYSLKSLLFMPVGCLLTLSPYLVIAVLVISVLGGTFVFYNYNVDLFGIGAPDFAHLTSDPRFEKIKIVDSTWAIQYENGVLTTFTGLVRHVGPIRYGPIPLLTHDILVTSGEYADPKIVSTNVTNHHYTWYSSITAHPKGRINLLHTVPKTREIYQKLLSIRSGQEVTVQGVEILKISALDDQEVETYWWQDTGCNTLLVTAVEIKE